MFVFEQRESNNCSRISVDVFDGLPLNVFIYTCGIEAHDFGPQPFIELQRKVNT